MSAPFRTPAAEVRLQAVSGPGRVRRARRGGSSGSRPDRRRWWGRPGRAGPTGSRSRTLRPRAPARRPLDQPSAFAVRRHPARPQGAAQRRGARAGGRCLADLGREVRAQAVGVIGWLKREEALPALISATRDPSPAVRRAAVSALAFSRSPHALARLRRRLTIPTGRCARPPPTPWPGRPAPGPAQTHAACWRTSTGRCG